MGFKQKYSAISWVGFIFRLENGSNPASKLRIGWWCSLLCMVGGKLRISYFYTFEGKILKCYALDAPVPCTTPSLGVGDKL